MAKKITMSMDNEIYKKLRIKQAKMIKKSKNTVSFSKVVSDALEQAV